MPLLTRLLLDAGALTYEGVEEAIKAQVINGGRIGTNLLALGLVTEEQLCKALEKCYGTPSVLLAPSIIQEEALTAIPEKFVRQHRVFPFAIKRRGISLAMADPNRRAVIADISYSTGLIVKPFVTPETRLDAMLEKYFGMAASWRYTESYEEEVAPEDVQTELRRPWQPLDRETAEARLTVAQRGREVPNAILAFGRQYFERALLFVVRYQRELTALDGFSPPRRPGFAEGFSLSLSEPSVFADIARSAAVYRGPLAEREAEESVIDLLGGGMPESAFVAPIVLRGRVANVLYADAGPGRSVSGNLDDMVIVLNKGAQAYDRIVRQRLKAVFKES